MKDKNDKIRALHFKRSRNFRILQGAYPRKYFESPKASLLTFILVIITLLSLYYFTSYKEAIVKIGLFAIFFSLYKIYKVWKEPIIMVNDDGITLRNVRFSWSKIRKLKIEYDSKNGEVNLNIVSMTNIITTEKVENFPFSEYTSLYLIVKAFKKKHRNPLIYKQKK
ncbi:hypothetical protein [Epilithonimonas hungarica]|jgi:hypothetical protein|uniref:PH domain-containing protein n=1 Tax=Epilithonimonas hungarica TaxID=454006 RepID=A0A1G7TLF0_9FLAO|nr:hypothetical protein [Epilithonimonas hungarica]MDP9955120.1 hypothetical protein [Epilithonimonas hungarica]SDG36148.1 hypothetical protein SAMN05421825_3154 [Epilithonimonas hungarica]